MSPPQYLHALAEHSIEVLAEGRPVGYPVSLAAAVAVAVDRLPHETRPRCSSCDCAPRLAAEPIPIDLFITAPTDVLPEPLAAVAGSAVALHRSHRPPRPLRPGPHRRRHPATAPAHPDHPDRHRPRPGRHPPPHRRPAGRRHPRRHGRSADQLAPLGTTAAAPAGRRPRRHRRPRPALGRRPGGLVPACPRRAPHRLRPRSAAIPPMARPTRPRARPDPAAQPKRLPRHTAARPYRDARASTKNTWPTTGRLFGDDHPTPSRSASNLAVDLSRWASTSRRAS